MQSRMSGCRAACASPANRYMHAWMQPARSVLGSAGGTSGAVSPNLHGRSAPNRDPDWLRLYTPEDTSTVVSTGLIKLGYACDPGTSPAAYTDHIYVGCITGLHRPARLGATTHNRIRIPKPQNLKTFAFSSVVLSQPGPHARFRYVSRESQLCQGQ